MKPKKFTILILIAIILILATVVMTRERQHINKLIYYQEIEDKLENNLGQSIQNFTELENMYNELQARNERLEWLTKEQGWQKFTITGYSANDEEQGTNNIVSTTFNLDYVRVQNLPIVASDSLSPYNLIEIEGLGGFIVLDRMSESESKERTIDILFDSKEEAIKFGRQELLVRIVE